MMARRNRTPLAVVLLGVVLASATGFAHDTWLLPDRFVFDGAEGDLRVALSLTSGMKFPEAETAIKPERVETARCRLAGQSTFLGDFSAAAHSLRCNASPVGTGTAALWIELKPKTLELTPAQVAEYLTEIDASPAVREHWEKIKARGRWRETYTKHAKTFVRVGPADASWSEPVGLRLEIVPEKDPTAWRAGDDFPVRVLKNGAPLKDFSVGCEGENATPGAMHKTDADGRVVFHLDQPGRWLLRGTDLREAVGKDVDWESDFTTLTVDVAGLSR